MAYLLEAYERHAIELSTIYSAAELYLLLEQTAKLRRDPDKVKAEIDAIENEEWIDNNLESVFVFQNPDGEEENFSISDFL